MELVLGLLILAIFAVGAWAMITRKLPALIVLPIMGVAIALVAALTSGRITSTVLAQGVLAEGAVRLHVPIITAFLGGMLSFILQKSGVAHSLVRQAAELIGDNPLGVALFTLALLALLFTSIGGLGAIIMVSLVVLPMMATVGIPPLVAGSIMLIGLSLGGIMNPGNWTLYKDSLGVQPDEVKPLAVIVALNIIVMAILFICIELWRANVVRNISALVTTMAVSMAAAGGVAWFLLSRDPNAPKEAALTFDQLRALPAGEMVARLEFWMLLLQVVVGLLLAGIMVLVLMDLLSRVRRWRHQVVSIKWYAYLIPVVPLLFVFVYNMDPRPAFLLAFTYAVLVTLRPGSVSMAVQSMIQGASSTMPAAILMVGIGIMLNALSGPSGWSAANEGAKWPVQEALAPIMAFVTPTNPFMYVIGFTLAAPLALYRGPLNIFGLGLGISAIFATAGLPGPAIVAMLLTVGQIQGICDPTNTVNVWLANELRVDVKALMFRTLPYVWVMVFVALAILATFMIDWSPGDPPQKANAPVATMIEGGRA